MAGKHTAGPWTAEISKCATHWVIRHSARGKGDGYNNRVAETCQWSPASGPQIGPSESAANAARIVACVNACEGIDDPSAIREVVEAAKRALNYIANTESELGIELQSGDMLRAALAKLEGRSND